MRRMMRTFMIALLVLLTAMIGVGLVNFSPATLHAQSGGTISYGARMYGNVSEAVPVVTYAFNGNVGDFVSVTVDSWAGTLDVQLDLIAPNGVILDTSSQNTPSAATNGAYLSEFLPETGAYLLRISGENATRGEFLLMLLGRETVEAFPLAYGLPEGVNLPINADPQYFTFEAEACPTTLVITDLNLPQGVPSLFVGKLRDQRGDLVAQLRGGEQREDWITVAPDSGRYELEITSIDPAAAEMLRLLVICAGENPACNQSVVEAAGDLQCTPCPDPDTFVPGTSCPDLNLTAYQDADTPTMITVTWDELSGATGYAVYVTGLISGGGETYLTHADWVPGDPLLFTWTLPEVGYDGFVFTLHVMIGDDLLCTQQTEVALVPDTPEQFNAPCAIRADREGVSVRVGPGTLRGIFTSLNPGIEYTVIGFAESEDGSLWWQLDKTQFAGHSSVISLWVAQADVTPLGDCFQIPQGDIPPVIPDPGDNDGVPGMWLPCGSCDTCGHPASECVTSPEGLCLWDPATCTASPGGEPDGGSQCYAVTATINMGQCYGAGSAMIDTPPNCEGSRYAPGTLIEAHALAVDPKCEVQFWTGCGVTSSDPSISFVPPGSCTVTAFMGY